MLTCLLLGAQLHSIYWGDKEVVLDDLCHLEEADKHEESKMTTTFIPSGDEHNGGPDFTNREATGDHHDDEGVTGQAAEVGRLRESRSTGLCRVVKPSSTPETIETPAETPACDVERLQGGVSEDENPVKLPPLEQEEDGKTPAERMSPTERRPQKMVYYIPSTTGLGDRLRGLVVSYYLAALMERRFLVMNPIEDASLIRVKLAHVPDFVRPPPHLTTYQHRPVSGERDLLRQENFTQVANVDVLVFKSNRGDLSQLFENPDFQGAPAMEWIMKLKERGVLWHTPLRTIMKPGEKIQQLLGRVREDHLQGQFFKVALHLRISDEFMMTTNRGRRDRIHTTSVHCFPLQVERIWDTLPNKHSYPDGLKVFVTADTPSYALEAQEALTSMNISWFDTDQYAGSPVHIRAKSDQTRTMLDWWLFTEMDFIIAPRSGFSETAAKYSCKGFSVFCPVSGQQGDCERFEVYHSPGLCQPMDFDMKPYGCPAP